MEEGHEHLRPAREKFSLKAGTRASLYLCLSQMLVRYQTNRVVNTSLLRHLTGKQGSGKERLQNQMGAARRKPQHPGRAVQMHRGDTGLPRTACWGLSQGRGHSKQGSKRVAAPLHPSLPNDPHSPKLWVNFHLNSAQDSRRPDPTPSDTWGWRGRAGRAGPVQNTAHPRVSQKAPAPPHQVEETLPGRRGLARPCRTESRTIIGTCLMSRCVCCVRQTAPWAASTRV